MERKLLSQEELEQMVKFDVARVRYITRYGESIFKKCSTCKGTGLYIDQYTSEGPVWDCGSYCSDCGGIGGEFVLGEIIFECNECRGEHRYEKIHCKKCGGTGYVDWLENIIAKPISDNLVLTPDQIDSDGTRWWGAGGGGSASNGVIYQNGCGGGGGGSGGILVDWVANIIPKPNL